MTIWDELLEACPIAEGCDCIAGRAIARGRQLEAALGVARDTLNKTRAHGCAWVFCRQSCVERKSTTLCECCLATEVLTEIQRILGEK